VLRLGKGHQLTLLYPRQVSFRHIASEATQGLQWYRSQGECDVGMCLARKGRRMLNACLAPAGSKLG
jgi:hypothetical protein